MVDLIKALEKLRPFRALVVGDFLLDSYTRGEVKRISPEAPVPILKVTSYEERPGGAGNVALNLTNLGGNVCVAGRVGQEAGGQKLKALLEKASCDTTLFFEEPTYQTPLKNRLISESQQLLRVDFEELTPLSSLAESWLIEQISSTISSFDVIALSDYGKGGLSDNLLSFLFAMAQRHQIPVLVDPKGTDFAKYKGATLLKPNLVEAYAAAQLPLTAPLETVAKRLFEQVEGLKSLLITRSKEGMTLFDEKGSRADFPSHVREVNDVTGAGDTVLSVFCLGMASKLDLPTSAKLANIAAGLSIERIGCVQIGLPELALEVCKTDRKGKIFDERALQALVTFCPKDAYSLLKIEPKEGVEEILSKVRFHAKQKQGALFLHVKSSDLDDEVIDLLTSFEQIDGIVL